MQFSMECQDSDQYADAAAVCAEYLAANPDPIVMTTEIRWSDNLCSGGPDSGVNFGGSVLNLARFRVVFDAQTTFWRDRTFTNQLGSNNQYRHGDTAYVQIHITEPTTSLTVTNVSLDNVWICTVHPDHEPLTVTQTEYGSGGCLSSGIDNGWPRHIVQNGMDKDNAVDGNVTVYYPFSGTTIRFSFPIEHYVQRTQIYVHSQITLDIDDGYDADQRRRQRRRQLLDDEEQTTSTQIRHFGASVDITSESGSQGHQQDGDEAGHQTKNDSPPGPLDTVENVDRHTSQSKVINDSLIAVIAFLCLLCVCSLTFCVSFYHRIIFKN